MKSLILTGVAALTLTSLAHTQVLACDGFNYTGALSSYGWTAHSGVGNKVIMSDGSVATMDQSSGSGEDVNLGFAAQGAADTTYASFDFVHVTGTVDPDGSGLYFAHFKDSSTFVFRARTGVLSSAGGGGDFVLAINGDNSNLGAGTSWGTELSFDTTYKVVISFNAGTGEAKLWVDPVSMASTSVSHTGGSTGELIEGFALRQASDYTASYKIDNVVVGKTFDDVLIPVPTSYCTSGTSASGCNALMAGCGVSSASATSGFFLTASGVEGQKNGTFFFGTTGGQVAPWGFSGSKMCVVAPRYRTGLLVGIGTVGGCDGYFSLDLNALWCASCPKPLKNPGAGATVHAQLWYRDPFNTGAPNSSLSDGLTFGVVP